MFRVPTCGQVATQPHRDRAGRHLGESRRDDDVRLAERAAESRCKREGNSEPIRHSNDDIAYDVARSEMFFIVDMCFHGSDLKYLKSGRGT
jgi:hypothetical protein